MGDIKAKKITLETQTVEKRVAAYALKQEERDRNKEQEEEARKQMEEARQQKEEEDKLIQCW